MKVAFRTQNKESRNQWLFSFQCSLATIVAQILASPTKRQDVATTPDMLRTSPKNKVKNVRRTSVDSMPNSDGKLKSSGEPRAIRNRLDTFGQVSTPTTMFCNDSDRNSREELKVSPTCWDQNLRAVEIPKQQEDNGFFSELPGTLNDTASPMSFLTKNDDLGHLKKSTNSVSSASSMLDATDQGSTSRIEKSAVKPKRVYIPPHKRRAMKAAQSGLSKNSAKSTAAAVIVLTLMARRHLRLCLHTLQFRN